jgi:hypothetical protein
VDIVRYPARCARPNCQTEINSGERAFHYPNRKVVYGFSSSKRWQTDDCAGSVRSDTDGLLPESFQERASVKAACGKSASVPILKHDLSILPDVPSRDRAK